MKKLGLLFASLVMIILFAFSASALETSGQCGDNVYWTFNESTGRLVIGGSGDMWSPIDKFGDDDTIKTVVIENGVTSIGVSAFCGCEKITSVTMPDSLTSIGNGAFDYCSLLSSITIPDGVKEIDSYAFEDCEKLSTIKIPSGVTYIGYGAFSRCDNLRSITVDQNNKNYLSLDGILFNKDKTVLMQYPVGAVKSTYTVPSTVAEIDNMAFEESTLTTVKLPDGLKRIHHRAFNDCRNLRNITIPDTVTHINGMAFSSCTSLTGIIIPDSVVYIGGGAFYGCEKLENISIPYSVYTIDDSVFAWCSNLKSITVDDNNENYSSQDGVLFNKDKTELLQYPVGNSRTIYVIPDGVKVVHSDAFSGCKELRYVTVPKSVTNLGRVFYSCENLISITVDKNNENYSSLDGVLFNKDKTELIRYPSGNSRTEYTIPYGVIKVAFDAFHSDQNITELKIPVTVTEFKDGYSLVRVTDVYYEGTESQWENIDNGYYSDWAKNKWMHFSANNYTHEKTSVVTPATCTKWGYTTYICNCGTSHVDDRVLAPHSYVALTVVPPTCESQGYTTYICENCSSSFNDDWKSPTGHDYGDDYICKNCGENKADNYCNCNCHKGGINGIIWKILRFFYKLFGMNKYCGCGVAHY